MSVLITWGAGEVGFTVEAPNAKQALKAYRGICKSTENVAEARVRQIVNEAMESRIEVRVDTSSPWVVQDRKENPTIKVTNEGVTIGVDQFVMPEGTEPLYEMRPDGSITLGVAKITRAANDALSDAVEEAFDDLGQPWVEWVYTDEIPIPTELTTGDRIDVKFRDGTVVRSISHNTRIPGEPYEATGPYWKDEDSPFDIVKYRRAV